MRDLFSHSLHRPQPPAKLQSAEIKIKLVVHFSSSHSDHDLLLTNEKGADIDKDILCVFPCFVVLLSVMSI